VKLYQIMELSSGVIELAELVIIIINQFYLKWKHASLAQLKADLQEGREV
jgi:hypothetical protein